MDSLHIPILDSLHIPILLFLHFQIILYCSANNVEAFDANTDKESLLHFKSVVSDPQNALFGWNSNSSHCSWFGVSCTNNNQGRVRSLNLTGLGLVGTIPPHLFNLTSLESLHLFKNSFYGSIPNEFSRLIFLRKIVLARNSINGTIPNTLSQCYNLEEISFEVNHISGNIPYELGNLKRLEHLDLALNNLSGKIPSSFGNLSSLTFIALARNKFSGNIPNELGSLQNLQTLQFSENQLTGKIPFSIFNMSSLIFLSLTNNYLSGELPLDIGEIEIEQIFLANNTLEGPIPSSLSNASKIRELDFSSNNFLGKIPLFGKMENLVRLHLGLNSLSSTTELNFQFMNSLSNCTRLKYLMLGSNQLSGEFPNSVLNLSIHLIEFCIDNNLLTGTFPRGFERFRNLTALAIHQNSFTGAIPSSIGELKQLQRFMVQRNRFSGTIPDIFGNLTMLYILTLGYNQFSGGIPGSLGKCQNLNLLGLHGNNLRGNLPKEIFGISSLSNLYLGTNNLSGSLPVEIGGLRQLEIFNVSNNVFSGNIPTTIGFCLSLRNLNMARNKLVGSIPESIRELRALESLDLSFNNLSGPIPEILKNLKVLKNLNLSFNDFEGPVPEKGVFLNLSSESIEGNEKLCGINQEIALRFRVSKCGGDIKSNKHFLVKISVSLAASIVFVCAILCFVGVMIYRKRNRRILSSLLIKGSPRMVSYSQIHNATNGFSSENLIGKGGFGSVYKAAFGSSDHRTIVAVKVLDMEISKANKSFNAECEALRNVRHRNLVKVVTSCSSIDHSGREFKALVMEFMSNGNLDQWLYSGENEFESSLSLTQRLSIAIDIASAMDYLHHGCDTPIVHCDLKPGNVLLDDKLGAHVGDFGLARFLSENENQNESSTMGLKGSIGYIAPEYGLGSKVSTKGDVYSFGILLLEIFTAKKPSDEMFQDVLKANKFASEEYIKDLMKIVDPRLLKEDMCSEKSTWTNSSYDGIESTITSSSIIGCNIEINNCQSKREECLVDVIRVGLMCVAHLSKDRLTMRETLIKLQDIKTSLIG